MHWESGVIRCFGSLNIIHHRPGDPAGVDQAPTRVPAAAHGSALRGITLWLSLRLQLQIERPSSWPFLRLPVDGTTFQPSVAHFYGLTECPPAYFPAHLHQLLLISLASSMSSSQGTLSSRMIRCFRSLGGNHYVWPE